VAPQATDLALRDRKTDAQELLPVLSNKGGPLIFAMEAQAAHRVIQPALVGVHNDTIVFALHPMDLVAIMSKFAGKAESRKAEGVIFGSGLTVSDYTS